MIGFIGGLIIGLLVGYVGKPILDTLINRGNDKASKL